MSTVFVTGANRGLGLEFTAQCLERGDRVFAGCRQPDRATALHILSEKYPAMLTVVPLNVEDQSSIRRAAGKVRKNTAALDLLINNAGVMPEGETLPNLNPATMLRTLEINAVAPIMVVQAFMELLGRADKPKIINISSGMGSLNQKQGGGYFSYCSSKAALNMLTRTMAFELQPTKIIAVVIDPGWVKTDMGGAQAPLSPRESIRGILSLTDRLSMKDSGKFFTWQGAERAW